MSAADAFRNRTKYGSSVLWSKNQDKSNQTPCGVDHGLSFLIIYRENKLLIKKIISKFIREGNLYLETNTCIALWETISVHVSQFPIVFPPITAQTNHIFLFSFALQFWCSQIDSIDSNLKLCASNQSSTQATSCGSRKAEWKLHLTGKWVGRPCDPELRTSPQQKSGMESLGLPFIYMQISRGWKTWKYSMWLEQVHKIKWHMFP